MMLAWEAWKMRMDGQLRTVPLSSQHKGKG
jgi:hypothetical protein